MKSPFWITTAALLAIGAGAYALTNAQEPSKPKDAGAAKDHMDMMTPGAEHKNLAPYVGKWNFKMKMKDEAGKPTETAGTAEKKMAVGGWFVEDMTKTTMMGSPFEGRGFTGYDMMKGKYIGVWMDTMGGFILNMEGTYDAAAKTFTYMMDMPDPATGKMGKTKLVEKWTGADSFTSTFTAVGGDGSHDWSIEYTRAK